MASTVILVAKVALTAYSAVSAVKALSEGNIMGAVMGGFGAYMGLSGLGAFDTAVAGDALAQTATAGQTTFAEGAQMGLFEQAGPEMFDVAGAVGGVGDVAGGIGLDAGGLSASLSSAMPDVSTQFAGDLSIGAPIDVGGGGFMDSIAGGPSGWMEAIKSGIAKVDLGGNLISTQDGSLLAKVGEAVGGTGNLMKMGGMAMDYLGKDKALKAQEDAAEEGYERSVAEAARKRASIGAAPGYVYGFGEREVVA